MVRPNYKALKSFILESLIFYINEGEWPSMQLINKWLVNLNQFHLPKFWYSPSFLAIKVLKEIKRSRFTERGKSFNINSKVKPLPYIFEAAINASFKDANYPRIHISELTHIYFYINIFGITAYISYKELLNLLHQTQNRDIKFGIIGQYKHIIDVFMPIDFNKFSSYSLALKYFCNVQLKVFSDNINDIHFKIFYPKTILI